MPSYNPSFLGEFIFKEFSTLADLPSRNLGCRGAATDHTTTCARKCVGFESLKEACLCEFESGAPTGYQLTWDEDSLDDGKMKKQQMTVPSKSRNFKFMWTRQPWCS